MSHDEILEILRDVEIFEDVPVEQLQWLIEKGEIINLRNNEPLFKKGSPIEKMYIILKGRIFIKLEQGGSFRVISEFDAKSITGGLPFSRAKEAIGDGIALDTTKILALDKSYFEELIKTQSELTRSLVHFMTSRVREFTKQQQQNDKMAALGKLSAGLAHELNNPSAAVVRSAQSLKSHLANIPERFKLITRIRMSDQQINHVNEILISHLSNYKRSELSMMEKADREDDLCTWLEKFNIDGADEIAENLSDYNFSPEDLELLENRIPGDHLSAVLNWINQVLTTEKMVHEIEESARRINNLVLSIKSYTHMDQSVEKQSADIHDGINNTIIMLQHKIRKGKISLVKDFQEDLPEPEIYVSELNQVWTNLLDNAIDALEESNNKQLKISTRLEGEYIKVTITDTGPGIPDNYKDKIFDPFFTTKKIGHGTGLGLDVVRQIVNQHKGKIKVTSEQGRTDFEIYIPIN